VKEVAEESGVSASCTMTSGSSTTRARGSNARRTPSLLRCYPCVRYKPLPM
jgi:hypothetical protein